MSATLPAFPGVLMRPTTPWMSGEAVVAVQKKLMALGMVPTDGAILPGIYSAPTVTAVQLFQRSAGLREDGFIGRITWDRLFATAPGALLPAPDQPAVPVPAKVAPNAATLAAMPADPAVAKAADDNYAKSLKVVLQFEGGYVNHPSDPGGATNKGVTFKVYDKWRRDHGLPTRSVREITDDEVSAIYRQGYWQATRCDELTWPTCMLQFDTAVNMGPGRATRFLRQSLGLDPSGRLNDGAMRVAATGDSNTLALGYCDARERFYRSLVAARPQMGVFLKGWLNRLNTVRRMAGLSTRESVEDELEGFGPGEMARVPEDGELDRELDLDPADPAHAPLLGAIEQVKQLAAGGGPAALDVAITGLRGQLASSGAVLPDREAMPLLLALRGARRFGAMRQVAEILVTSGVDSPAVRQEYAQALIEEGMIVPAIEMLERVLADTPPPEARAGLVALIGRGWKQLHVGGGGAAALRKAIARYEEAMPGDDAGLAIWPAINLVALSSRAQRQGIDPGSPIDPMALAGRILALTPETGGPWELATLVEANVALGRWPEAEQQVRSFLAHTETSSFAIASLLRQLTEIWQLDAAPGGPGSDIIATLRAALMKPRGGVVSLTQEDARELAATPRATLQRVLGEPGIVTWTWMQTGLARAAAVGVIRRPDGRGVGTGFLVRGSVLDPRLGDAPVLLTNAHVLSPDLADQPAVSMADAEVVFEAAPGTPAFRVRALPWHSPVEALDACIAELDPTPAIEPCPVSDAALPEAPGPDGGIEASHRLYIIGHPRGGALAFSIQDNLLIEHEGPPQGRPSLAGRVRLHYRTPTEPGSSGSPVFDALGWRVVALHHAGGLIMPRLNGQPGTHAANEGIWIGSIRHAIARYQK